MIRLFNMRNIAILLSLGCDVAVATNLRNDDVVGSAALRELGRDLKAMGVARHHVSFERRTGTVQGAVRVVRELRELQRRERFDVLHTHQPAASVLARVALAGKMSRVLYTAHGFQFFQGGPRRDWLAFFPIEAGLSRRTDVLFTINSEDANLARRRMHPQRVVQIPGVGIDWKSFQAETQRAALDQLRRELGIPPGADVVLSIGELTRRKNHATVIRALARLEGVGAHFVVCGTGPEQENLKMLATELGLSDRVTLAGFRSDIRPFLALADVAVFPSLREGLGMFGLEAMAAGLPLIASDLSGPREYMDGGESGCLLRDPLDPDELARGIAQLLAVKPSERAQIADHNRTLAAKFDNEATDRIMRAEYQRVLASL
jgi:glycosyltransferase involved in cell wall biosynthesis